MTGSITVAAGRTFWTEDRDNQLRDMWTRGLSCGQISYKLGIARGTISRNARRLGLNPRPSPLRTFAQAFEHVLDLIAEDVPLEEAARRHGLSVKRVQRQFDMLCWMIGRQAA